MASLNRDSVQPSFGERRGHRLAPLNTTFSQPSAAQLQAQQSARLQRPRPSDYPSTNGSEGPVPLQSPVKRQSSKSSLRSLFSRDKSTRAATAPDSKLAEIEETQPTPTQTLTVPSTPVSSGLLSPGTTASTPTLASPTTPRARATLKTARTPPSTPKQPAKPPPKEQYGWKPPPLFQAYPQSIKHECLLAPAMSADSILRLHATTGKSGAEDGRKGISGRDSMADASRKKKKESKERKHLRTLSGTINKVEWSKKIYVLATTGFILQYAGEGKNDRLPEKMLQLGPQSVAFASDAIPGKHWVVQISRDPAADAGPVPPEPPKPKFSRFGFHRSPARRLARSFLLVFDNPDSMISWLMALRAEIEARGGPKFTAEKHSDEGPEPQLRPKSSARQIVKKDPHRVSSLFLQPQNLGIPNEDDGQSVGGQTLQSRRSSYVSVNRRSMIDSRAGSSTSTGWTETIPTTPSDVRASSFTSANLPSSPPTANGAPVPEEPESTDNDSTYTRSPPTSSHGKRQSLFASPKSHVIPLTSRTESTQPSSPPSRPDPLARSASPPAPNFSVPSFSKKFVPRQGPTPTSHSQQSVAGVLRRGESVTDFSIASISSPPQSPTYSVASSRYTDSSEPSMVPHDGTGRRTLRAFNSEDALSRMVRSGNTALPAPNFSRVPRSAGQFAENSEHSSRPPSMAGRAGLGITINNPPSSQTAPQAIPSPPAEPNSRRISTAQPDNQLPQSVSRRKSMPGLAIGPPAAPPPNCPLPKIPSPIVKQAPPFWSSSIPEGNDRNYQSPPVRQHAQDRRKSGMVSNTQAPPSSGSGSKSAARQSRLL